MTEGQTLVGVWIEIVGRVKPGREVDDVGRAQPDVGDVGARVRRAFDERGGERLRRGPHVAPDDQLLRAGEVSPG